MLDENDVTDAVANYLEEQGFRIIQKLNSTQQGIDLKAKNQSELEYWVETKGETSSRPGSARHGKPYTASQVFDRVSKGTYTAIEMRQKAQSCVMVALAVPDTPMFRKYLMPILPAFNALGIRVFLVSESKGVFELTA